ncbi:MAG: hypothetical protein HWN81_22430 [Candidatus Lokiarchaeota archaeon]|nr:hypothetical protein [Candidatus Lokiarchaeota archaeon]
MTQKFSWLIFYIIVFSTASACLMFIPYPITKVLDDGNYSHHLSLSREYKGYHDQYVEFPWRSYNQEFFLNISLPYGNISIPHGRISLQIMDRNDLNSFHYGWPYDPYVPYLEVINTTGFTINLQIHPPFEGKMVIWFYTDDVDDIAEEDIIFYSEIKVTYIRYATSYSFFFLGIAVLLISYYGHRRYKWWRNKY